MKIAIVECDVPLPELKEEFGTYTNYFATLLKSSVDEDVASTLEFVTYEAYLDAALPTNLEELDGLDGILLTGSRYNSYDNDPWILKTMALVTLAYRHVKLVGICFGHQLIARALGGTVAVNPEGWEVAVTSTTTFSCELLPSLSELRLQQMHRDIVTKAPKGSTIIGSNDICAVQALYEPHRYFSVQGHPEFNQKTVEVVLRNRMRLGIVPAEYGEDALRRAAAPNDGQVVGAAIVEFFKSRAA